MSKPNGIFLFTFVLLFLLFHGTGSKVKGRQLEIFFFFFTSDKLHHLPK